MNGKRATMSSLPAGVLKGVKRDRELKAQAQLKGEVSGFVESIIECVPVDSVD